MEERENPQPPIFDIRNGSREILSLIAEKWTMLVLYALTFGVKRHGELKREIPGISQKMLTQTLRNLERDGLVKRIAYEERPPRVEYALTPLGEMLGELLKNICVWSEQHYDKILAAREHYERKLVSNAV